MEILAQELREWEVTGQVLGHWENCVFFLLGSHSPGSTCVLHSHVESSWRATLFMVTMGGLAQTLWDPGVSGLAPKNHGWGQ